MNKFKVGDVVWYGYYRTMRGVVTKVTANLRLCNGDWIPEGSYEDLGGGFYRPTSWSAGCRVAGEIEYQYALGDDEDYDRNESELHAEPLAHPVVYTEGGKSWCRSVEGVDFFLTNADGRVSL